MKIMIASDLHGSAAVCRKLLEAFDREGTDKLLLLGDILYHGPRNSLPQSYEPQEVIDLLNQRRDRLLCVRGNCDTEVDQMVLDFPILADYCLLWTGSRTVFATHGHRYNLESLPPLSPGDILLHGHTHVPAWVPFGTDNFYLNPGSPTIPKQHSIPGYLILTQDTAQWKDLEGTVYHTLAL